MAEPDAMDIGEERDAPAMKRWEQAYERTWDVLEEDESGQLKSLEVDEQRAKKRKLAEEVRSVRRGMIRFLYIIVDLSRAARETDLKPSRAALLYAILQAFVREFFDQNPISQLGIIVTRDGKAEKLVELSGNPRQHLAVLKEKPVPSGDASLQNALDLARSGLSSIPTYGNREVLVLFSAMSTCDPGDIYVSVEAARKENVRCSVVLLSAELRICRYLTEKTAGSFGVALSSEHLRELVFQHASPPVTTAAVKPEASLIRMGFPQRHVDDAPALCACHGAFQVSSYQCPRCRARLCELPTDCPICRLTLVSSPHLARSYHHLFPIPTFVELPADPARAAGACFGCCKPLEEGRSIRLQCPSCSEVFCIDCDAFIHDSLNNCPGCECLPPSRRSQQSQAPADGPGPRSSTPQPPE